MPLTRSLNVANMSFNAIHEYKILAKISEFTVSYGLCHKKTFLVCNTNLSVQLLRLARLMKI